MNKPIPLWKRMLGCSNCTHYWHRGDFDLSTVRGMVSCRFWLRVEWFIGLPRSLKWRLANRLAHAAQKLRGDQTYDLGYGIESNLAGMLEDSVRMKIVRWQIDNTYTPIGAEEDQADAWKIALREEEREEFDAALKDLAELGGLAKASHWLPYWEQVRRRDYRRETPEPKTPEFDY